MAQRRPIASHPAFAPLVAAWFAALFGLTLAVLPQGLFARALGATGLDAVLSAAMTGRITAIVLAVLVGGGIGLALGRVLASRALHDPRPIYAEPAPGMQEPEPNERPARRPLRVREELADGFDDAVTAAEDGAAREPDVAWRELTAQMQPGSPFDPGEAPAPPSIETGDGFMILTPQPVHPPQPAPDIESLLAQFDSALAAFRSDDASGPATPAPAAEKADPVHAFVARQTGSPAPSPLGGLMPDHQAELRAALDKLARAHRNTDG